MLTSIEGAAEPMETETPEAGNTDAQSENANTDGMKSSIAGKLIMVGTNTTSGQTAHTAVTGTCANLADSCRTTGGKDTLVDTSLHDMDKFLEYNSQGQTATNLVTHCVASELPLVMCCDANSMAIVWQNLLYIATQSRFVEPC